MAVKLNFKEKAQPMHFGESDDIWDKDLIYRIESNCIHDYLRSQANLQSPRIWKDNIEKDIKDTYAKESEDLVAIGRDNLEKAAQGKYEKMAPTDSAIRTWLIFTVIAVLAELSVVIIQGLFSGDFNPFIIVLAIMLGLGGILQGYGLGTLFFRGWLKSIDEGIKERHHAWWTVGIGTVLILLVSGSRAFGSFETLQFLLVFFITLFFGEAVAISEAMHKKLKETRKWCLGIQLQAQRFHATRGHTEKLEEYKKFYEAQQSQKYLANPNNDDIKDVQSSQRQDTK